MSTKIVSFYDIDTDTVVELELSEEDAVRAQNGKSYFLYKSMTHKILDN